MFLITVVGCLLRIQFVCFLNLLLMLPILVMFDPNLSEGKIFFLFGCSEEEKKSGHFSPQFDHNLFKLHHSKGSDVADACLQLHQTKINSESPSGKGKSSPCMDSVEANVEHADGSIIIPAVSSERLKSFVDADMQEFSVLGESIELKTCNLVSVGDLSCAACGKLLFHPLVLNCGHGTSDIILCTCVLQSK